MRCILRLFKLGISKEKIEEVVCDFYIRLILGLEYLSKNLKVIR